MKTITFMLSALLSIGLAACGAGGSSGPGIGITPPAGTLLIDANNVKNVTSAVLKSLAGSNFDYYNPEWLATTVQTAPIGLSTNVCEGGSSTDNNISLDLNPTTDPLNPAAGSGTITFKNCLNPQNDTNTTGGKTFNGTVTLTDFVISPATNLGDPDDIRAAVNFNNLKITGTNLDVTLSGGYTLHGQYSPTPMFTHHTDIIDTDPLHLRIANSTSQKDVLTGFGFNYNTFTGSMQTSYLSFGLSSDALLGGFSVACSATPSASLFRAAGKRYPGSISAAQIHVAGTLGSQILIEILGDETSSLQIKVQLDTGNGAGYATPIYYAWSDLSL